MSVPSQTPAYTKPAFGLLHAAAEAQVADPINSQLPADSTLDPLLHDYLRGRPWYWSTPSGGNPSVGLNRSTGNGQVRMPAVDFIAYAGNNWYRRSTWWHLTTSIAGTVGDANALTYQTASSPIIETAMPGNVHWFHKVGDPSGGAFTIDQILSLEGGDYNDTSQESLYLSELWATKLERPEEGQNHSWIYDTEGNLLSTTTNASTVYTVQRGPSLRVFNLQVERVPAANLGIWKRIAAAMDQGKPFIYVPPEFGRAIVPRLSSDDTDDYALTIDGGAAADSSLSITADGHEPSGKDVLTISVGATDAGGNHTVRTTSQAFPNGPEDWRGKWLRVDIRIAANWTWLTTNLEIFLRAWSDNQATTYDLSPIFLSSSPPADEWIRCYVDLENHPHQTVQTTVGVDLSQVDAFEFTYKPETTAQDGSVGEWALIDPNAMPAIVKAPQTGRGHSIQSDGDTPLIDPTYRVSLQLVETIA